jgi:putative membrane protein
MKRITVAIILAGLFTTGYCYKSPSYYGASTQTTQTTRQDTTTDAKVLDVMVTLNNNEITMADLALNRATKSSVKNFAKMMKSDHGRNLSQMQSFSQKFGVGLVPSSLSKSLKSNGRRELSSLMRLNGDRFDKAYMTTMVKGHEKALQVVDSQIREARNPKLKKSLETTRNVIMKHLEKAKMVQRELI